MIIRTIIYLGIVLFFIWDMKKDPKSFKKYIFPIVGITYFAGSPYFSNIDDRIQLTIKVITTLTLMFYLWSYYKDFKVEKFREKKRQRDLRDKKRDEENQLILEDLLEGKNQAIKNKSTSYEITLDMPKTVRQIKGQVSLFKNSMEEFIDDDYPLDQSQTERPKQEVLDNQIDIFKLNKED